MTADWLLFWVYYQKSQENGLTGSTNDSATVIGNESISEPDLFGNESIQYTVGWNSLWRSILEIILYTNVQPARSIAEDFYYVGCGLSIITSNVCQIIVDF